MKLKVILSDSSGFCEGVARAVNKVKERASGGEKLATLGPIVHNPQVVRDLEDMGVRVMKSPEDWKGETVVIRTHGVPPSVKDDLEARGAKVLDLTCPRVAKVQKLVARAAVENRPVVIAGDPGHAESVGLKAFAGEKGVVVPDPRELDLPEGERVLVVAQTTQSENSFRAVADAVGKLAPDMEVNDTICPFTVRRQAGILALIDVVDMAIVVGGRDSANTRRLLEIFIEKGIEALLVEGADEIRPEMFGDAMTVGVAAGASTPPETVREVVEAIENIDK